MNINNEFKNMQEHVEMVNDLLSKNNSIIVFDTETTGLETDAKIIQFSAILYQMDNGAFIEKDNMDIYINPQMPLPDVIIKLTGITDDTLKYAASEKQVIHQIMQFMNKANVWAAYNNRFDMEKLEAMANRCNYPYKPKACIDVLRMAKNMISKQNSAIKNYKLATVTQFLFPNFEARYHDSLEDVRATAKCLTVLAWQYKQMAFDNTRKDKLLVDWASFWQNPHNLGQRRIKVFVNRKDIGVFWDCKNYCWSAKKDALSQHTFSQVDIAEIEKQVLLKYGPKFDADTMEDLARNWGRTIAENQKVSDQITQKTIQQNTTVQNPSVDNLSSNNAKKDAFVFEDFELW